MEEKVKRLERAVIILSLMTASMIGISVYAVRTLVEIKNKLPDYQELKTDVQAVKAYYEETRDDAIKYGNKAINYGDKFINYLNKEKENGLEEDSRNGDL